MTQPNPAAASVKRYDCALTTDGDAYMREGSMWVLASDYDRAIAERDHWIDVGNTTVALLKAAIAARDAARRECERLKPYADLWELIMGALEAQTEMADEGIEQDKTEAFIRAWLNMKADRDEVKADLARANAAIRNMGETADAERRELLAEVERLRGLLRPAREHVQELADAWQRGCLTEHDGNGGMRSNRNWDLMCKLERELGLR